MTYSSCIYAYVYAYTSITPVYEMMFVKYCKIIRTCRFSIYSSYLRCYTCIRTHMYVIVIVHLRGLYPIYSHDPEGT